MNMYKLHIKAVILSQQLFDVVSSHSRQPGETCITVYILRILLKVKEWKNLKSPCFLQKGLLSIVIRTCGSRGSFLVLRKQKISALNYENWVECKLWSNNNNHSTSTTYSADNKCFSCLKWILCVEWCIRCSGCLYVSHIGKLLIFEWICFYKMHNGCDRQINISVSWVYSFEFRL